MNQLRRGKIRGATYADFAAAPLLFGEPLNQAVAVAHFLAIQDHTVAVRVDHTANVWIADRVALCAPISRIRCFEFFEPRDDAIRETDESEDPEAAGLVQRGRGRSSVVSTLGEHHRLVQRMSGLLTQISNAGAHVFTAVLALAPEQNAAASEALGGSEVVASVA